MLCFSPFFKGNDTALQTSLVYLPNKDSFECKEALFVMQRSLVLKPVKTRFSVSTRMVLTQSPLHRFLKNKGEFFCPFMLLH